MHHVCSPDHGFVVMCSCLAAAVGMLAGKLLGDWEHRKPPS